MPIGRDAELIASCLKKAGLQTRISSDFISHFTASERDGMGVLLMAEEALTSPAVQHLSELLLTQPQWSDLPVVVFTTSGGETPRTRDQQRALLPLGHFILLERPIRPATLISTVEAAMRARKRQFEIRDAIGERENALSKLQISEEHMRRILQSTHDCVKVLDLDGRLLSMNEEGQRCLGIKDVNSVYGQPWRDFWKADAGAAADAAIREALAGQAGHFEGFFETLAGEASWWDVSVTPVLDRDGRIVNLLAISRDITSRKLAEQALIQNEKLAAVGRLAASISHEINNPLEAVTNLLYIVKGDPNLPEDLKQYLRQAEEELARVSQIVSQTLRFHRQTTRPMWTSPPDLVSSVILLYQARLNNFGIATDLRFRGDGSILCFEGEIRQVLSNLIGNAVDAMRSGGTLTVRTHPASHPVSGVPGITIVVSDSGHGMEKRIAERVFEPFYTTKGIGGTGLGLWISRGIVEKHHGTLRVRSRTGQPRQGTIFSLFLPKQFAS